MVWGVMNTTMVLGVVLEAMEAMMDIMTTMDSDILEVEDTVEDTEDTMTILDQGNVFEI